MALTEKSTDFRRILVTGAAGFIGGACARQFLARGFRVTALAHHRAPEGLEGAEVAYRSLLDRQGLADLLEVSGPFGAVIHCAGLASDVAAPKHLLDANYHAVRNLVECLSRHPSARLVHVSTTDVYGIRDFVDADENTPLDDNRHNAYARSKILAERCIAAGLPASRYVLLRPGAVCGQGDTTILPRVLGFLHGSRYVVHFGRWRGSNRWPLANVQNVAVATVLAATCDEAAGQSYNVVDPQLTTVEQYNRWVLHTFLPDKVAMRSITIPLGVAWPYAFASTCLARLTRRGHPLFEPSLYALYSIASNLDLSSRKLEGLFTRHGERFIDSLTT